MAVERKYERDIDILLAEEFEVSTKFASWFLKQTNKFLGIEATVKEVFVSKSDSTGESDLVVIFEKSDGDSRFALLIEDKIDAPLQPEQEKRYRDRADAEVLNGAFLDYEVVLCSPVAYRESHPEAHSFDSFVSYEAIGDFLRSFGTKDIRSIYRADFITTAAKRRSNSWTRVDDAVTNDFWKAAYELATKEFPILEMKERDKLTKNSLYIEFHTHDMPTGSKKKICIAFKGHKGIMDLSFNETNADSFRYLVNNYLEEGMTVHQTGKSAAIRLTVDNIKVSIPDEVALSKIRAGFVACERLIKFYRKSKSILDNAAFESVPSTTASH